MYASTAEDHAKRLEAAGLPAAVGSVAAPTHEKLVTMESEHPYPNSANIFEPLEVADGGEKMLVWFDNQSATERNYDFVRFYKTEDKDEGYWGEEKYSGGLNGSDKNWPTFKSPLEIDAGKCWVYFESDGSNNDWGYIINAVTPEVHKEMVESAPPAMLTQVKLTGEDTLVLCFQDGSTDTTTVSELKTTGSSTETLPLIMSSKMGEHLIEVRGQNKMVDGEAKIVWVEFQTSLNVTKLWGTKPPVVAGASPNLETLFSYTAPAGSAIIGLTAEQGTIGGVLLQAHKDFEYSCMTYRRATFLDIIVSNATNTGFTEGSVFVDRMTALWKEAEANQDPALLAAVAQIVCNLTFHRDTTNVLTPDVLVILSTMLSSDQLSLNLLAARMLHNLTATPHIDALRGELGVWAV